MKIEEGKLFFRRVNGGEGVGSGDCDVVVDVRL